MSGGQKRSYVRSARGGLGDESGGIIFKISMRKHRDEKLSHFLLRH